MQIFLMRTKQNNLFYSQGFTLFELIVVLSILSLVASLSTPYILQAVDKLKVKSAAHEIFNSLKTVRQKSILNNFDNVFLLDIENNQYQIDASIHKLNLPEEAEFTFITAESELLNNDKGGIRFFHDGSSTGGKISLIFRQKEYEINVNWLTGHIELK